MIIKKRHFNNFNLELKKNELHLQSKKEIGVKIYVI